LSKMGYSKNERVKVKVEFLRMLTNLQVSKEKQTILMSFFESYLQLNDKEEESVMKEVSKLEEAKELFEIVNPYVERGKRIGREEGRVEGREEGAEQRNMEIACDMLQKGYSMEVISDITKLSIERIEQLKINKSK